MPMSDYMRDLRDKVGNELLEVPAASVAVYDSDGRVLLIRHTEGNVWVVPGGAIEPLEVPADAAVREVWEETGLIVELDRLVGVYGGTDHVVEYANGDRTSYLMVVFGGRVVGGELRPDGEEAAAAAYYSHEEAMRLDLPVWMPRVLEGVFAGAAGADYSQPTWTPQCGKPSDP